MSQRISLTAAAAAILCSLAPAQQLVRDIVQTGPIPSSEPTEFFAMPNFACFRAATPDAGREPWVTDGTAIGTFLLRDIALGAASSDPLFHASFQGDVVFTVGSGPVRSGYRTDGTIAGTQPIPDLGIPITRFVGLGNGLLLADSGSQMHTTSLTPNDAQPIPGMVAFSAELSIAGITYGWCQPSVGVYELWRTDGTIPGSVRIATLPGNGRPYAFTPLGGRIYLIEGGPFSYWISSTDGTSFQRGVQLGAALTPQSDRMHVVNGELVFAWSGSVWHSDLTIAGTGPLSTSASDVRGLVEQQGQLYFRGYASSTGYELWTTDGTAAGTVPLLELMPGTAGSHPEHLRSTPQGLLFRALLPNLGRRIVRLSGGVYTDLGAIPDDAPSQLPVTTTDSGFVPVPNGYVFGGTDATGVELWNFDGSQPATRLVDIAQSGPGLIVGNTPAAAVGDRLFFTAYDGQTGLELWSTDGTAAGTNGLDLQPGPLGEFLIYSGSLARFGDRVAFASQRRTGVTDGTAANTVTLLAQTSSLDEPCKVARDEIWFMRQGRIWHSDGTVAGTVALPFLVPNTAEDFEVLSNAIVVRTISTIRGTNGLTAPLILASVGFDPAMFRVAEDRVAVVSSEGIWGSDGTANGTQQLATISFAGAQPRASNGSVVWAVADGGSGLDIWRTDGTASGTSVAANAPAGMTIHELVPTRNELFVIATTANAGRELWRLDQGSGQLVLVLDLATGPVSGVLDAWALGSGDRVLVAGGDIGTGIEPYIAGAGVPTMALLADIHAGRGNSNPRLLGIAGDSIYVVADDGLHGAELWSLPLALAGAASVQEFGSGCPGSAGTPALAASGVPTPGDPTFGFELTDVRGLALSALGIANTSGSTPFGGCELLLGGAVSALVRLADVSGTATFPLPVPNVPALVGVQFATQGFALDSAVAAGFVASPGLMCVVGG